MFCTCLDCCMPQGNHTRVAKPRKCTCIIVWHGKTRTLPHVVSEVSPNCLPWASLCASSFAAVCILLGHIVIVSEIKKCPTEHLWMCCTLHHVIQQSQDWYGNAAAPISPFAASFPLSYSFCCLIPLLLLVLLLPPLRSAASFPSPPHPPPSSSSPSSPCLF